MIVHHCRHPMFDENHRHDVIHHHPITGTLVAGDHGDIAHPQYQNVVVARPRGLRRVAARGPVPAPLCHRLLNHRGRAQQGITHECELQVRWHRSLQRTKMSFGEALLCPLSQSRRPLSA